jgi:hypothetical protein
MVFTSLPAAFSNFLASKIVKAEAAAEMLRGFQNAQVLKADLFAIPAKGQYQSR